MKRLLLLLIILIHSGEVSAQNKPFTVGKKHSVLGERKSKKQYFPIDESKKITGISSFENEWYSGQLEAMNEPIIYKNKVNKEVYRFTWLRSFHHPVAIRIEHFKNNYCIYWKLNSGSGGGKPGKLILNKKRIIDKNNWDTFISKLNASGFWMMSTNESDQTGMDGAQWILEGKAIKRYHLTVRWTPNPKSQYYACCDYLLGLTDLKISGREKY
jgi:hypothetical protein